MIKLKLVETRIKHGGSPRHPASWLQMRYEATTTTGPRPWSVLIPWTALDSGPRWDGAMARAAADYQQIFREALPVELVEQIRFEYIYERAEWDNTRAK